MNIKIRATLLLFVLSLAFAAQAERRYEGFIDLTKLKVNHKIDTVVVSVNSSIEAVLYYMLLERLLPAYAPNAINKVVILEGMYGQKIEDGRPKGDAYNDLAMFADVYSRLGATMLLQGQASKGGRDPFATALAEVYPQQDEKGVYDEMDSAYHYLINSDFSTAIHLQAAPLLSLAEAVKSHHINKFSASMDIRIPAFTEDLAKTHGRDFTIDFLDINKKNFSNIPLTIGTQNYGTEVVPKFINTICDEDDNFKPFFAMLNDIILEPTGKSMGYFIEKQSNFLAKKTVSGWGLTPKLGNALLLQMSELLDKTIAHEKSDEVSIDGARQINQLRSRIFFDYNLDDINHGHKFNRLMKDLRAHRNITIPMLWSMMIFFVHQVEDHALFRVANTTGQKPAVANVGGANRFVISYSGGKLGGRQGAKQGEASLWALLDLMADLFTNKVQLGNRAPVVVNAPAEVQYPNVIDIIKAEVEDLPPPYPAGDQQ